MEATKRVYRGRTQKRRAGSRCGACSRSRISKTKANSRAENTLVNAKEIHQDRIAKLKDEVAATVAAKQAELDAGVKAIQDEVIKAGRSKNMATKKSHISGNNSLTTWFNPTSTHWIKCSCPEELTAEERAEIEKHLAQLKIDLNNAIYEQVVTLDEVIVKAEKERAKNTEKLLKIFRTYIIVLHHRYPICSTVLLSADFKTLMQKLINWMRKRRLKLRMRRQWWCDSWNRNKSWKLQGNNSS